MDSASQTVGQLGILQVPELARQLGSRQRELSILQETPTRRERQSCSDLLYSSIEVSACHHSSGNLEGPASLIALELGIRPQLLLSDQLNALSDDSRVEDNAGKP